MRILLLLSLLLLANISIFIKPTTTYAQVQTFSCESGYQSYLKQVDFVGATSTSASAGIYKKGDKVTLKLTFNDSAQLVATQYKIMVTNYKPVKSDDFHSDFAPVGADKSLTLTTKDSINEIQEFGVKLFIKLPNGEEKEACSRIATIQIYDTRLTDLSCSISMPPEVKTGAPIDMNIVVPKKSDVRVMLQFIDDSKFPNAAQWLNQNLPQSVPANAYISGLTLDNVLTTQNAGFIRGGLTESGETASVKLTFNNSGSFALENRKYHVILRAIVGTSQFEQSLCAAHPFEVKDQPTNTDPTTSGLINNTPEQVSPGRDERANFRSGVGTNRPTCSPTDKNCTKAAGIICDINATEASKKDEIVNPPEGRRGILTALGCIPTDPKAFIEKSLPVAFGASGGVAFLLMIMGAFQMITSAGNPDNVKKGREQFNSAIIGLLFILFSVLILQIVGFNILNIPGFG